MREGSTSNYAADHEAEMERLGKRFEEEAPPCDCMNSSQQARKYILLSSILYSINVIKATIIY